MEVAGGAGHDNDYKAFNVSRETVLYKTCVVSSIVVELFFSNGRRNQEARSASVECGDAEDPHVAVE